jgi:transposase
VVRRAHSKNTYLGAQYWRLCRRLGKAGQAKAILAVGHSILIIVWHLLNNDTDYIDLGPDYVTRRQDATILQKRLVRRLEQLGHKVTLEPAPAA